jgi:hypothetical protein
MNNSYLVTILTFGTQAWDRRLVHGYRPKHHRHYYSFLCSLMPSTLAFLSFVLRSSPMLLVSSINYCSNQFTNLLLNIYRFLY